MKRAEDFGTYIDSYNRHQDLSWNLVGSLFLLPILFAMKPLKFGSFQK